MVTSWGGQVLVSSGTQQVEVKGDWLAVIPFGRANRVTTETVPKSP
jgi:hypothetical protein